MAENDWKKRLGTVYSTNPEFQYNYDEPDKEKTPEPGKQLLYIELDRKGRKGKVVTLITGFRGKGDDLAELGKDLKKKCGTGGSVKDGEIIIQGDFKKRAKEILEKAGYKTRVK